MGYRVLVTGSSRGIGKAVRDLYLSKGYDVTAPGRKELDLENLDSVK